MKEETDFNQVIINQSVKEELVKNGAQPMLFS